MDSDINLETIEMWKNEQLTLRDKLIINDTELWQSQNDQLTLIGGIDISYIKEDNTKACICCVVLDVKDNFKIVYVHNSLVTITAPYIPGFLAFREVKDLVTEVELLKQTHPQFVPQIWIIDGNGILHPRHFGIASHFGVLIDMPSIGAAKNPYFLNYDELNCKEQYKNEILKLKDIGDSIPIRDPNNGQILGAAVKTSKSKNPIFVSIGHRISLETAIKIVLLCCKFKVPEPTRHADIISREFIRNLNKTKKV